MDDTVKYLLAEAEIPTHWVNLLADLPGAPAPPLHPGDEGARWDPRTWRRSSPWG